MEVNKSLPIALILGLATQGAAIIWTVSMMAADIEDNAEKYECKTYINVNDFKKYI